MADFLRIEKAQPENTEEILDIQRSAFYSEGLLHNDLNIPPLKQTREELRNEFGEFDFFIAYIQGTAAGTLKIKYLENQVLWIGRLAVHPDHQQKGIGSALMEYIEQTNPKIRQYQLFTAEKSTHNIRFYEKLEYSVAEYFTDESHPGITLVNMVKILY